MWRITLFGNLEARWENQVGIRFGKRKTGVLLACLAHHFPETVSREQLCSLLWPELDNDAALNNLRVSLHRLRNELSVAKGAESLIVAISDDLGLDRNITTTDVTEYKAAVEAAKTAKSLDNRKHFLVRAANLYGGNMMQGVNDNWVIRTSHEYCVEQCTVLSELVSIYRTMGDIETAIAYAKRAIELNPTDERFQIELMRIYESTGRDRDVLLQYELFLKYCRREFSPQEIDVSLEMRNIVETSRDILQGRQNERASLTSKPNRSKQTIAPPQAAPPIALAASNLPTYLTSFFDRIAEIQSISTLLLSSATRLVTLIGMGGVGKTHLAVEATRPLLSRFNNLIFFVSLVEVHDASLILDKITVAVLRQRSSQRSPLDQLAYAIGQARILVVLDNFEHLIEGGPEIVHSLLQRIPAMTVLITSRERLNISGERYIPLSPLPIPANFVQNQTEQEIASVQMFMDRARAVCPDFSVTEENKPVLTALCNQLEGIPLAIELAAAWVNTLTLPEIREQLTHRFELLVSHYQNFPARHRSLRATIDFSFKQLSPLLQKIFTCLSVFDGGWSLEAAEAVCEVQGMMHLLRQLQEKSLIEAYKIGNSMRYDMLETLREYAWEQLSADDQLMACNRHIAYFTGLVEEAAPHLGKLNRGRWPDILDREHANILKTLDGLISQARFSEALHTCVGLRYYWQIRHYFDIGINYLERLIEANEPISLDKALAFQAKGNLLSAHGKGDTRASLTYLERSLQIVQQLNEPASLAENLYLVGHGYLSLSDYDPARNQLRESLDIYTAISDSDGQARVLHALGSVEFAVGNLNEAQNYYQRSLIVQQPLGAKRQWSFTLLNLASILAEQRQDEAAIERFLACSEMMEEIGEVWGSAVVNLGIGACYCRKGEYSASERYLGKALATFRNLGIRLYEGIALCYLGELDIQQNRLPSARRYLHESLRLLHTTQERKRIAETLQACARLAVKEGDLQRAVQTFGAAEALLCIIDSIRTPKQHAENDYVLNALHKTLPEAEFETCWNSGSALTWEEAINYVLKY